MAFNNTYQTEETIQPESLNFLFISSGKQDIVKVIEYRYVQDFSGFRLFNLGFGDYDMDADCLYDQTITNNADHYAVFHTVLNTIPRFFEINPNAIMMVQGSDHGTDFAENCKQSCRKRCDDLCKNLNRRISAYRWYVNKNFEELTEVYTFYGGLRQANGKITTELYVKNKQYDSVFCKKN